MNEALKLYQPHGREKLLEWAKTGKLYALIDPYFDISPKIEKAKLDTRDTDPVFYEVIAWDQVNYQPPWIASVDEPALDWILHSLPTERWGLFIASDAGLETLARHFQKFVIAKGPDANPYFLRFHDASVLEVLLRTWEPKEKSVFFGPAFAFGLPDLDTMDVRIEHNPFTGRTRLLPKPEDCLLHLKEGQLKACGEAIDRDLVKVLYWHLRNHHAKAVQFLNKDVLESRIQYAIRRGRRYSLGTVSDLAGYTALMFELAPNFDEHPSFRHVLDDPSIPPDQKMKRLSQVITDQEWSEATMLYDRSFWPTVLKTRRKS